MAPNRPPDGDRERSDTARPRDTAPAPTATQADASLSPIDYLTSIYRDESVPRERRMDAAKAVVAYVHPRITAKKATDPKKPARRIVVVWGPSD